MYNKDICKKCKYHAKIDGRITCDYAIKSDNGSCLKRIGKNIIDTRGKDPNNCLLYEKGKPDKITKHLII